jgi:nucleoside-diphosphate-sugar epimerase
MTKIAFLAGTSGLVGMQLLHQLITSDKYQRIISFGRRELALKHPKLIQVTGDFKDITSWNLEDKIREREMGGEHFNLIQKLNDNYTLIDCFCTLGTTIKAAGSKEKFFEIDHDFVVNFAKWAQENGANQFLYVSASGADKNSNIFYSQVKGKVEESLQEVGFEHVGIFRPALLMGNRLEFRLGEEFAKILMKPLVWFKLFKKIRPVYDHQVAKAMLAYAQIMNQQVTIIPSEEIQNYN